MTTKKYFILFTVLIIYNCVKGQIISTVAGEGLNSYTGDGGPATAAELNYPLGVVVNTTGNIFIADQLNNRIRKVNTSGVISTIAGDSAQGYSGDGGQATAAELFTPFGVALDTSGNIYIADNGNNRIRRVDASTGIITTVAGNGTAGYFGDGGPATAAELANPTGVTLDDSGNIYIADYYYSVIRKVNATTGIISTIAGNYSFGAGYSGDGGQATSAELNNASGVALDASGNLYIADYFNHRIRKVNTSTGIISTVAGNGTAGYSGDGTQATAAELNNPSGVGLDISGNIYISDEYNHRIREVNAFTGIIATIAGDGTGSFYGDGGQATAAELHYPYGVTLDATGNIYIADQWNNRIRKITNPSLGNGNTIKNIREVNLYPNPNNGVFTIQSSVGSGQLSVEIYNVLGEKVHTQSRMNTGQWTINLSEQPNGVYFYRVLKADGSLIGDGKLVIQK